MKGSCIDQDWSVQVFNDVLCPSYANTHTHTHTHTQLINEISEENGGVIISFPRMGTGSDKVLLKGAKQCTEGAAARVREIVEDLVSG